MAAWRRSKVIEGMEARAREGRLPASRRSGTGSSMTHSVNDRSSGSVTAPLVREAFELYASGKYSLRRLCRHIHERGLRARRGGALAPARLYAMFKNPFYAGWVHWRGVRVLGPHPALVSTGLFSRATAAPPRGKPSS